MKRNFFYAVATLIGMTVGAGIFSLPYVASQAGFFPVLFYLVLLWAFLLLIHLFYAQIILATSKRYRLIGYAGSYLGKTGKAVASLSILPGFLGILLIYLIIGGRFLNLVLSPVLGGPELLWTIVFFAFNALIVFFGLRIVASLEFFMSVFLFLVVLLFLVFGWSKISLANLLDDIIVWPKAFLPYGIVLFSLLGIPAIPEVCQILKRQKGLIKKAIFWGTLVPLLIYIIFVIAVFGISGKETSTDAISGLIPFFGQPIILAGAIFGLLAVSTSFLVLGTNLRKAFQYDYKLGHFLSWILVCFVPLGLYFLGLKNFIFIIALVGAVMGGVDGILIILIYRKVKRLKKKVADLALGLLGTIFVLGIIYQLFQIF